MTEDALSPLREEKEKMEKGGGVVVATWKKRVRGTMKNFMQ